MGNFSSESDFLNQWTQIQRQGVPGSLSNIWARKQNRKIQMQQYTLHVTSQEQVDNEKRIHELRHNHPYLVSSLYFKDQTESQFCSSDYKGKIYLERISLTLETVTDIPFPDALHVYEQSLQGFYIITSQIEKAPFPVSEEFFGINYEGVCKVWMNNKYDRNYPSTNSRIPQENMVKSILEIVEQNVDFQGIRNLPTPKQYIYARSKAPSEVRFNEAIYLFRNYVNEFFNGKIPSRLDCVDRVGGAFNLSKTWKNRYQNMQNIEKHDQRLSHDQLLHASSSGKLNSSKEMVKQFMHQQNIHSGFNNSDAYFRRDDKFVIGRQTPQSMQVYTNEIENNRISTPSFSKVQVTGEIVNQGHKQNNLQQNFQSNYQSLPFLNNQFRVSNVRSAEHNNLNYQSVPAYSQQKYKQPNFIHIESKPLHSIPTNVVSPANRMITQTIRPMNNQNSRKLNMQVKGFSQSEHLTKGMVNPQQPQELYNSRIKLQLIPMRESRIQNQIVNEMLVQPNQQSFGGQARHIIGNMQVNNLSLDNAKNIDTPVLVLKRQRSSFSNVQQVPILSHHPEHIQVQQNPQHQLQPILQKRVNNSIMFIHPKQKQTVNYSTHTQGFSEIKLNEQQKVNSKLVIMNQKHEKLTNVQENVDVNLNVAHSQSQGFKQARSFPARPTGQFLTFKQMPVTTFSQQIQGEGHLQYNEQSISSITGTQNVQLKSNEYISDKFSQVKEQLIDTSTRNFYNNMMNNMNNNNFVQKQPHEQINSQKKDKKIQSIAIKKPTENENYQKIDYLTSKKIFETKSLKNNYNVNLNDGMSSHDFLNELKNMKFMTENPFKKTMNTFDYGATTTGNFQYETANKYSKFNNLELQQSEEYKFDNKANDKIIYKNFRQTDTISKNFSTENFIQTQINLKALESQKLSSQQFRSQLYTNQNKQKMIYEFQDVEDIDTNIRYKGQQVLIEKNTKKIEDQNEENGGYITTYDHQASYNYGHNYQDRQNIKNIQSNNDFKVANLGDKIQTQYSWINSGNIEEQSKYTLNTTANMFNSSPQQVYKVEFDPEILADLQKLKGVL